MYNLIFFLYDNYIKWLNRRLGNDATALRCYSDCLTSINSPQKVKELARDGKDKIKGEI